MSIWTTCAGIVQTWIANPSKRGTSVAIFNGTRQAQADVVAGVGAAVSDCVGLCGRKTQQGGRRRSRGLAADGGRVASAVCGTPAGWVGRRAAPGRAAHGD